PALDGSSDKAGWLPTSRALREDTVPEEGRPSTAAQESDGTPEEKCGRSNDACQTERPWSCNPMRSARHGEWRGFAPAGTPPAGTPRLDGRSPESGLPRGLCTAVSDSRLPEGTRCPGWRPWMVRSSAWPRWALACA